MKFGKLLAVGRSWVGEPGSGRYQMRKGFDLPKFISPKNPFKLEKPAEVVVARPAVTVTATRTTIEPTPLVESGQPEPVRLSGREKLRSAGLVLLGGVKKTGATLVRMILFCVDHNPFSSIGKSKLAGVPRLGHPKVQGELSLDRVKMARNDLTHADLEVVSLGGGHK
ncbi:MAG: hypothetical protein M9920_11885 [Verrucomicrobiae bacterium]|nr:hypothetical protein [Verrucomicrobiae bacterium]